MYLRFTDVRAREILDSRGNPTLAVTVRLGGTRRYGASVPSGASTGSGEAVEMRDGDPTRYRGLGVLRAVENVNGEIRDLLLSRGFRGLADVDEALLDLDGTANKSRLGANAIVGVSMAVARAAAAAMGEPLWRYLTPGAATARMPVPHFNIVNGGAHAPNPLDFQEFMIAPIGAPTEAEAVRAGAAIYRLLRTRLAFDGLHTGLGDEGGFAPDLDRPERVLTLLTAAIGDAGYAAGRSGVAIALDPAANGFRHNGTHGIAYRVAGRELSTDDMIEYYAQLVDDFPIWSIEDGLAEDDTHGWVALTARLGHQVQLVGDDIFVTNPATIAKAVPAGIANAALIKPNQIGTVTETLEAIRVCSDSGYAAMVSHRSGETGDTFIADLAVGTGCGQIKTGAPARGERVAKYNRLMEIEGDHGLPYGL